MAAKENYIYLNGVYLPKSEAKISVYDHGLLYGDGVFEGITAHEGIVFQLKQHIERLYKSANYIRLNIQLTREQMVNAVLNTLRRNRLKDAYIRLVVTRGEGDLGIDPRLCKQPTIFIIAEHFKAPSPEDVKPVTLHISSVRRDPVDSTTHEAKSLNYLNSILARQEAIDAGANQAILLDHRGFVSEADITNVFVVKENVVSTPSAAAGILHGVTRARVIRLLRDLGYELYERDVTPYELLSADEVFLTGTRSHVLPVAKISGRLVGDGRPGPMTRRVMQEYRRLTTRPEEGTPIYEELKLAER